MRKILFIFLLSGFGFCALSQTKQIENLQKQQQVLQEEIKNTNKLFLDVKKQTTTILQRIQLINKQISARKELIDVQRNEISTLDKETARLESEIAKLDEELGTKKAAYAKAINGMLNNNRSQNKLFFILSGKSLGESLRRMQYLKNYSQWRKEQAEEIKTQNAVLKEKKDALAKVKTDKVNALAGLQTEQHKLEGEEKVRRNEMTEAKGKQQELQKTLQDKRQIASKLNAQIEKLIAEEVARQEREALARRKAEEAERKRIAEARKAEQERIRREELAQKKKSNKSAKQETATPQQPEPVAKEQPKEDVYIASAETFNLSSSFASNKGRLPMPVTGTSSIVSGFGVTRSSEWNVSTNSNGVDIQAQQGADIRSVFDGEVSKVFSFPGSNTCVIIRHGDYYTFYANIIGLYVKQGDKVKTGQALGKIFTDPDTGISNMHFQLWQKTVKLDPKPWLKR